MLKKYNVNNLEDIKRMYNENTEFAEYVAAFARTQKISIDEALEWSTVRARAYDLITRY